MNREELNDIKNRVLNELKRRRRINELLGKSDVMELLDLEELDVSREDIDEDSILKSVLNQVKIKDSNKVYVLIGAYSFSDCCIEGVDYPEKVSLNSMYADYYMYQDIETYEGVIGFKNPSVGQIFYEDFERDNIVLNPCNGNGFKNGFDNVRFDFFKESIKNGQDAGLKKIYSLYNKKTN